MALVTDAPPGRRIAAELALLVAVVVLPLAGLAAYLLYQDAQNDLEHSTVIVRRMAGTVADRAQGHVESARTALEALARRPLVRVMDPGRCDPALAEMRELYPRTLNILVVNLDGRILCGAIPPPRDREVRIADDTLQKEMRADPRFRMSRPFLGGISKRLAISAVQPVFDEERRLVGTVGMSFDLLTWFSFAGIDGLDDDAVAGLTTREGIAIARSTDAERWLGRDVSDGEIHRKAVAMREGTVRATGAAGIERLWGIAQVPGTGWFAIAGLPSERVFEPAQRRVLQALFLVLVTLGIAVAVATILISRLLAPLRAISAAVRERGAGNAAVRVPQAGPREIADLAGELNRMIDAGDRMRREQAERDEDLHRFRAAVDISGDAVLLIDRATLRYVDVNQTFCELVGYSRDELLGMTPMDLFSADRATLERDYDAIIADNNAPASKVDGWYRRKDGSMVPIETRRRALRTKDGWIIVGTARDMSERRESEARISRLNRVHQMLSGINAAIVRIRERHQLFEEACRIAAEAGGFVVAWVGLIEHDGETVVPVAWKGAEAAVARISATRYSLRPGHPDHAGIIATMAATRKAVVVNDVAGDPRVHRKAQLASIGVRSVAVFPLLADDEVAGLFALQAPEAGFFDEQEVKLLQELAGDISFALEHIGKTERVDYLAYYDELTGLANRRLFVERLTQVLHAAGQAGEKLALVVADVERLRIINESLGRTGGDAVLKGIAARLAAGADRADLARLSADHFAVVLQPVKGKSAVTRRLGRLWQEVFGAPIGADGTELRVGGRAGIAMFPGDGADPDALIRSAEAALRRAKQTGERHVFHASEMTERNAEKLTMENRLREALEREEFVLHYQPKVDAETRRILGVEALIRWQNPELGLVPPGQFIPLMEETGIILEVGAWALRRAVQDHKRWTDLGLPAPRVAVNVSAVQLRKRDYVDTLRDALRGGTPVPGVDLEITESLVMDDIQGNIEKLKEVRNLGVAIAIDDFGTGYSSLAYLARLPVQALKIDRSFIITMLAKPDTMTLVSTMISLAHSLKLKVVAEGVDSEEQAKMLRLLRCDEVQGFLFSRPLPFDDLTALLRRQ